MRSWIQYGGIVAGSVVVAAVAAEAYLAWMAKPAPALPFYNRLYPYVMFRPHENNSFVSAETHAMSRGKSKVFHYTNGDGFRVSSPDYDLPKRKPAGQFRVAVLGASAVQLGSTFETTLPGSLRSVLRSKYPGADIEVINAGIQSSVSRQSIVHLLVTVLDYQPDVVILYDGVNDIGLPLTFESRANFPYNFRAMEEAWESYRGEHREPLADLVLSRSRVWRAIRGENAAAGGPTNAVPASRVIEDRAFVREHIAGYLSNWRKLIELSAAYGYEPVCVLQPTGILDREFSLPLLVREFRLDEGTATAWVEALAVLYEEAERQIEAMRGAHPNAALLNLRDYLRPAKEHFWDLVHVYDEVNLNLAGRIYADLKPRIDEKLAGVSAASARR